MNEIIYLVGLHYIGISQKKLNIIFEQKSNYKEVFENLNNSFLKKYSFTEKSIANILKNKQSLNFEILMQKINSRNVEIITKIDPNYPNILKEAYNSPYLLYVRGKINSDTFFSIVGSRGITSYGEKAISSVVNSLSKYFTIVSGGALGCDTSAHKETIKSGGKTIAVIGTGIDIDYPSENKKLYDQISSSGAIISIFPLGEKPNGYNFPIRNEIISGLSVGTLVVEAKEKSGTLITAKLTLDMGRDLFAIPGDIFKTNSLGCNNLIKKGEAKLVLNANDILEEYNINLKTPKKKIPKIENEIDKKIYELLLLEPFTSDELAKKMNIEINTILFRLSMLEVILAIKKSIGGKYEVI